jgi:hypothetical protein
MAWAGARRLRFRRANQLRSPVNVFVLLVVTARATIQTMGNRKEAHYKYRRHDALLHEQDTQHREAKE